MSIIFTLVGKGISGVYVNPTPIEQTCKHQHLFVEIMAFIGARVASVQGNNQFMPVYAIGC